MLIAWVFKDVPTCQQPILATAHDCQGAKTPLAERRLLVLVWAGSSESTVALHSPQFWRLPASDLFPHSLRLSPLAVIICLFACGCSLLLLYVFCFSCFFPHPRSSSQAPRGSVPQSLLASLWNRYQCIFLSLCPSLAVRSQRRCLLGFPGCWTEFVYFSLYSGRLIQLQTVCLLLTLCPWAQHVPSAWSRGTVLGVARALRREKSISSHSM